MRMPMRMMTDDVCLSAPPSIADMPLLTLQAEKAGSPTWPFGINKGLRVIPQVPFVRPDA